MRLPYMQPMVLVEAKAAFDDPDFVFEAKLDGFRAVAYIQGGQCELISRKKHAYRAFDGLARELGASIKVQDAVLDGEIVCPGADGRPVFEDVLYRRGQPYFYAFDVMWLNGNDLRKQPLMERKAVLRGIVPSQPARILYVDHVEGRGVDLYQAACELDLEGVVAKWKEGEYAGGGDETSWIKVKNPAYSQGIGRREQFARFRRLALRRAAG